MLSRMAPKILGPSAALIMDLLSFSGNKASICLKIKLAKKKDANKSKRNERRAQKRSAQGAAAALLEAGKKPSFVVVYCALDGFLTVV